jgi:hypothetical protein
LLFGEKKSLTGRRAQKGEILFKKKAKLFWNPTTYFSTPLKRIQKKYKKTTT